MVGVIASHAVNACALDGTRPATKMAHEASASLKAGEGNVLLVDPLIESP
jgi:hypothetical protein